ncbi:unnamed protein product [Adineta ricciae]|uniref:UPAR/Ly6 domain-containing protein n=1 Tax=Adineta ricciae TaxID=249248 RepID=A0A814FFF5_ADIRI|nr:unnamed protein product [Adineta ricciae]
MSELIHISLSVRHYNAYCVVFSFANRVNCQSLVSYSDRNLQCYSCSDCPEPFFYVPTQVTITPPDVGQCMKTVVTVAGSNRLLVSKGFTRSCISESSANVRVYCCQYNFCNGSHISSLSTSLLLMMFILTTLTDNTFIV